MYLSAYRTHTMHNIKDCCSDYDRMRVSDTGTQMLKNLIALTC